MAGLPAKKWSMSSPWNKVGKIAGSVKTSEWLPYIYGNIHIDYIHIFDTNMRSGSHALLHVEKSEKNGVLRVLQILHERIYKNMKN